MLKLVIDTNIIVSAMIKDSIPRKILKEHVISGKSEIYTSQAILDEYENVLLRKKFNKYFKISDVAILLEYINLKSIIVEPIKKFDICKDKSDNKFIEVAYFKSSDYLITGNFNDFKMGKCLNFEIISATNYWNRFSKL